MCGWHWGREAYMCDACDQQINRGISQGTSPGIGRRSLLRRLVIGGAAATTTSLWLPRGAHAEDSETTLESAGIGEDVAVADAHPQGTATAGSSSSRITNAPASAGSPGVLSDPAQIQAPNSKGYQAPHIVSRKEWGASENIRMNDRYFAPIRKLIVHHSASPNKPSNPVEVVRSIERFHIRKRGFSDIGYNYLIDHKGVIYEGRAARNYASGETHGAEDTNGWGVVGAHAKAFNAGAIGVCLLGDFEKSEPSDAAIASLIAVFSWKASRHRINPRGTEDYLGIYGRRSTSPNIGGHRDVGYTLCPGAQLNKLLPTIRERVAKNAGNFKSVIIDMQAVLRHETGPLKESTSSTPTSATPTKTATTTPAKTSSTKASTQSSASTPSTATKPATGKPTTKPEMGKPATGKPATGKAVAGYRVVSDAGQIYTAGQGRLHGNPAKQGSKRTVGLANGRKGDGYWALSSAGVVYAFGGLQDHGSPDSGGTAVDLEATSTGGGYLVLMQDGGIYPFGDALHHGSPRKQGVSAKALKIAVRPQGDGYWVLSADNVIRGFGSAKAYGSPSSGTVVDLWPTPTGKGYWALASNGAVSVFGDASDQGDVTRSGQTWSKKAAHIIGTPSGGGYTISNSEGALRAFGDAPLLATFAGSGMNATGIAMSFA